MGRKGELMHFMLQTKTFEPGFQVLRDSFSEIGEVLSEAEKFFSFIGNIDPLIPKEYPEAWHAEGVKMASRYMMGLVFIVSLGKDKLEIEGDRITYTIVDLDGELGSIIFSWWMNAHGTNYNFSMETTEKRGGLVAPQLKKLGWNL